MSFFGNGDDPIGSIIRGAAQVVSNNARFLAATTMIAAQYAAVKLQNDTEIKINDDIRRWLKDCWIFATDEVMGNQRNNAKAQFVNYIAALENSLALNGSTRGTSYSSYMADALTIRSQLDDSIDLSGTIFNDLYLKNLLSERLTNLATLRTNEVSDANIDAAKRRTSTDRVTQASTNLARAKEDAIIKSFDDEAQRIEAEEGKKGYYGGDGMRDKLLLKSRTDAQDAIAENNKGTELKNTTLKETLEQELSARDFDLSQTNRGAQFAIYEDDVGKRLSGFDAVSKKVAANDKIKVDDPEDMAKRAFDRRFSADVFKVGYGPANYQGKPDLVSAGAVLAGAAGSMISGKVETGATGGGES